MKKVSFLFAFVLLIATASNAETSNVKKVEPTSVTTEIEAEMLIKESCTVKVTTGGYESTITFTCQTDCTKKEACDKAYAAASFLLKFIE